LSTDNNETFSGAAPTDSAPVAAPSGTPAAPSGTPAAPGNAPFTPQREPQREPRPRFGGNRYGSSDGGGQGGPRGPRRPRPGGARGERYTPRRKVNGYCLEHVKFIDYKDVNGLRRFLSERGKIEPRRKTGASARCQRMITVALKRARHMALLPFVGPHNR
jgi:small subunit ribosomal protein S18